VWDWKDSIIGSQANDRWEMQITGLNGFERTYALEGTAGEHEPQAIGTLLLREGDAGFVALPANSKRGGDFREFSYVRGNGYVFSR
jgi:hypothetical protein